VLGSGFVGLVVGACLADFGMLVACADVDEAKIRNLKAGKMPIYEPGLEELIRRGLAQKRLFFTHDVKKSIQDSLVIFVAVGTEARSDGRANLSHVRDAALTIGRHMNDYKVVVIKSTVPVGTADRASDWIRSAQIRSQDFDVVSNPEFLREGAAVEDFMRPNRVLLGCNNPRALAIIKDIYRPLYLIETPFVISDNRTAEIVKYATNSFLAIKISYINEIARLCDRVGSDVHLVAKSLGLDGRIGPKFLHPGPGFGGSCLPKDTRAFLRSFEDFGLKNHLIRAAVEVNREQSEEVVQKLVRELGSLRGRVICLLGLSYKPNTNDVRESPALRLCQLFLKGGARVRAFDPVAVNSAKAMLRNRRLSYGKNAYDAARDADAIVLATEWNEFRNLDLRKLKAVMAGDALLDARNIYDPATVTSVGFRYLGIGRAGTMPKAKRARGHRHGEPSESLGEKEPRCDR
jgi:UDPglucose 6-dehydrogenase